jgi:hypothetical protein
MVEGGGGVAQLNHPLPESSILVSHENTYDNNLRGSNADLDFAGLVASKASEPFSQPRLLCFFVPASS